MDIFWVVFLGWLMGGYGVLLFGSCFGLVCIVVICVVSLVLWLFVGFVVFGFFDGFDDWLVNLVFGFFVLGFILIWVDCGNSDLFYVIIK